MCEWDHEKSMGSNAIVLGLPNWCDKDRQNRIVCVDKCIVESVKHLWNHRIETLANCCGHGKMFGKPSLVLPSNYTDNDLNNIKNLILEVDKRGWALSQWKGEEHIITKEW